MSETRGTDLIVDTVTLGGTPSLLDPSIYRESGGDWRSFRDGELLGDAGADPQTISEKKWKRGSRGD